MKSSVDTALIMASGLGTRSLPIGKAVSKEMSEVLGRPVIDYILEYLAAAGIKKVLLRIGADDELGFNLQQATLEKWFNPDPALATYLRNNGKDDLLKYSGTNSKGLEIIISSRTDYEHYGTAASVFSAREILRNMKPANGQVLVVNGDDFMWRTDGGSSLAEMIDGMNKTGAEGALLTHQVDKLTSGIYAYGMILSDQLGKLAEIKEKPSVQELGDVPPLCNLGKYVLPFKLLDTALEKYMELSESERGQSEYYLTDVLTWAANSGMSIYVHVDEKSKFIDAGSPKARLLASLTVAGIPNQMVETVAANL